MVPKIIELMFSTSLDQMETLIFKLISNLIEVCIWIEKTIELVTKLIELKLCRLGVNVRR